MAKKPTHPVNEDGPQVDELRYNAEAFHKLAALEEANFWFKARNKLILHLLSRYFPSFSSFLEVGCGTGFVLSAVAAAFPAKRYVGVEPFAEGLAYARSRLPEGEFHQLDARRLPFKNEFDLIGSFDVLEHIQEDQDVLRKFHEALKPGGGLLIAVPQHQWLWSATDEAAGHVRRYARADLENKIRAAGFQIERSLSFVSLPLPLMFLSRLKKRNPKHLADGCELNLPKWQNDILENILAGERMLIKAGVNFPCGGSRIVIARRDQENI